MKMFNSKPVLTILAVPIMAMLTISTVQGAGKGATPNGKPFVELNGYVHEIEGEVSNLQDQIDSVVARVDTIEDRVGANETAISDLQQTNATLQAQIDANANDIASLESSIAELEAANADLQNQIDTLGDADGTLQDQIDANSALITTYAQSIDTLGGSLQAQIDNNSLLIAALQGQITDINDYLEDINTFQAGQCPSGYFVKAIQSDGSLVCGPDETGLTGTYLQVYTVSNYRYAPKGYSDIYAWCPSGWVATGGSHQRSPTTNMDQFRIYVGYNYGYSAAHNWTYTWYWHGIHLKCARIINY
jgi:peptidoglycan hydrolase CwlO-like protein